MCPLYDWGENGEEARENNEVGLMFLFCLCHGLIRKPNGFKRTFALAFVCMNFVCLELDLEK